MGFGHDTNRLHHFCHRAHFYHEEEEEFRDVDCEVTDVNGDLAHASSYHVERQIQMIFHPA